MFHILDMLLRFETKVLQRRLWSKMDAKFWTFWAGRNYNKDGRNV